MSALILKISACVFMCLDHIGYHTGMIFLRLIGRMAFPIFAFMIAYGYTQSRKPLLYATRLLAFAFISECIYDFCFFKRAFYFSGQNVYFTLFIGLFAIYAFDTLKKRAPAFTPLFLLIPLVGGLAAELLASDYGALGVYLIFLFYLVKAYAPEKHETLLLALVCAVFAFRYYFISLFSFTLPPAWEAYQAFAAASLIFIALYNGKRGIEIKKRSLQKIYQYAFYLFYPSHLVILGLIFN